MDSKTVKIKQSSAENHGEDDHMSETAYALIDDYKKSDSKTADERPHFDITGNKTKLFERPTSPSGPKIDVDHKEHSHSQQTPTMVILPREIDESEYPEAKQPEGGASLPAMSNVISRSKTQKNNQERTSPRPNFILEKSTVDPLDAPTELEKAHIARLAYILQHAGAEKIVASLSPRRPISGAQLRPAAKPSPHRGTAKLGFLRSASAQQGNTKVERTAPPVAPTVRHIVLKRRTGPDANAHESRDDEKGHNENDDEHNNTDNNADIDAEVEANTNINANANKSNDNVAAKVGRSGVVVSGRRGILNRVGNNTGNQMYEDATDGRKTPRGSRKGSRDWRDAPTTPKGKSKGKFSSDRDRDDDDEGDDGRLSPKSPGSPRSPRTPGSPWKGEPKGKSTTDSMMDKAAHEKKAKANSADIASGAERLSALMKNEETKRAVDHNHDIMEHESKAKAISSAHPSDPDLGVIGGRQELHSRPQSPSVTHQDAHTHAHTHRHRRQSNESLKGEAKVLAQSSWGGAALVRYLGAEDVDVGVGDHEHEHDHGHGYAPIRGISETAETLAKMAIFGGGFRATKPSVPSNVPAPTSAAPSPAKGKTDNDNRGRSRSPAKLLSALMFRREEAERARHRKLDKQRQDDEEHKRDVFDKIDLRVKHKKKEKEGHEPNEETKYAEHGDGLISKPVRRRSTQDLVDPDNDLNDLGDENSNRKPGRDGTGTGGREGLKTATAENNIVPGNDDGIVETVSEHAPTAGAPVLSGRSQSTKSVVNLSLDIDIKEQIQTQIERFTHAAETIRSRSKSLSKHKGSSHADANADADIDAFIYDDDMSSHGDDDKAEITLQPRKPSKKSTRAYSATAGTMKRIGVPGVGGVTATTATAATTTTAPTIVSASATPAKKTNSSKLTGLIMGVGSSMTIATPWSSPAKRSKAKESPAAALSATQPLEYSAAHSAVPLRQLAATAPVPAISEDHHSGLRVVRSNQASRRSSVGVPAASDDTKLPEILVVNKCHAAAAVVPTVIADVTADAEGTVHPHITPEKFVPRSAKGILSTHARTPDLKVRTHTNKGTPTAVAATPTVDLAAKAVASDLKASASYVDVSPDISPSSSHPKLRLFDDDGGAEIQMKGEEVEESSSPGGRWRHSSKYQDVELTDELDSEPPSKAPSKSPSINHLSLRSEALTNASDLLKNSSELFEKYVEAEVVDKAAAAEMFKKIAEEKGAVSDSLFPILIKDDAGALADPVKRLTLLRNDGGNMRMALTGSFVPSGGHGLLTEEEYKELADGDGYLVTELKKRETVDHQGEAIKVDRSILSARFKTAQGLLSAAQPSSFDPVATLPEGPLTAPKPFLKSHSGWGSGVRPQSASRRSRSPSPSRPKEEHVGVYRELVQRWGAEVPVPLDLQTGQKYLSPRSLGDANALTSAAIPASVGTTGVSVVGGTPHIPLLRRSTSQSPRKPIVASSETHHDTRTATITTTISPLLDPPHIMTPPVTARDIDMTPAVPDTTATASHLGAPTTTAVTVSDSSAPAAAVDVNSTGSTTNDGKNDTQMRNNHNSPHVAATAGDTKHPLHSEKKPTAARQGSFSLRFTKAAASPAHTPATHAPQGSNTTSARKVDNGDDTSKDDAVESGAKFSSPSHTDKGAVAIASKTSPKGTNNKKLKTPVNGKTTTTSKGDDNHAAVAADVPCGSTPPPHTTALSSPKTKKRKGNPGKANASDASEAAPIEEE